MALTLPIDPWKGLRHCPIRVAVGTIHDYFDKMKDAIVWNRSELNWARDAGKSAQLRREFAQIFRL